MLGVVAWLVPGGAIAAAMELALVRRALRPDDDDRGGAIDGLSDAAEPSRDARGDAWTAAAMRLAAHVPTALVLAWGAARVVSEAYDELIRPGDPAIPVVIRVVARVPDVASLLVATWLLGEAVGGAAVRHRVLGAPAGRALFRGLVTATSPAGLVLVVVGGMGVALGAALAMAAVGASFGLARVALLGRDPLVEAVLAVSLLGLATVASLGLLAALTTWRSLAWTALVRGSGTPGTFGPSGPDPAGGSRTVLDLAP